MLFLTLIAISLVSVPLSGGHLGALAEVRFRRLWLLFTALGLQILIISVIAGAPAGLLSTLHLGTYLMAGVFVISNRDIPGVLLVGFGGLLNLVAIAANGGVMPVSPDALAAAGHATASLEFSNSVALSHPSLLPLGDIFAVPESWPVSNVFSIGDVCIALGAAYGLHRICGSRALPRLDGTFAELRGQHSFVRLWAAQAISSTGDWVYALAVASSVVEKNGGAHALAVLLIMQTLPAVLAGTFGGPLIDRLSRRKLMISSDVARAAAVGTLVWTATPSLGHIYVVAVALGLFGALFQPSAQASIPNLVPRRLIVTANALLSATAHMSIMMGPVIGGLLVARLGLNYALAINAASFAVSSLLILRVDLPHGRTGAAPTSALRDLVEGMQYVASAALVRGVLLVTGTVMFAAAIRVPLEPLLVFKEYGEGPQALGLAGGIWGLGMVIGSGVAPLFARRWPREKLLGAAIGVVGAAVLAASRAGDLSMLLSLWFVAGCANAIGTISYESLLQERTPDAFRGRVLAASEAVLDCSFLAGVLASGWLGSSLGVRNAFAGSGVIFVLGALLSHAVLGRKAASPQAGARIAPKEGAHASTVPEHAALEARVRRVGAQKATKRR